MRRERTAFSGAVQNSANDRTLQYSAIFLNDQGDPDDIFAGAIVNFGENTPSAGYHGIDLGGGTTTDVRNGGQWYATLAADGALTNGTYAFLSTDYNFATWSTEKAAIGINTLGNPTIGGRAGTALKIVAGKQYFFGEGNFSTVPTATQRYATIADGLLVPAVSKPAAGSLYFEILQVDNYTEGAWNAFPRYRVIADDGTARR